MINLMNIEDIARMHKCSIRHARDVVVRSKGFPVEAPTSSARNRLWLEHEVLRYLNRNQDHAQTTHEPALS